MTPEMTDVAERILSVFKNDVYKALEDEGSVTCNNEYDEEGKLVGRTLSIRYYE